MIIVAMSHLKRLILIALFSQLIACGQKGALTLADQEVPPADTPPPKQQPEKPPKKGDKQ